MVGVVGRRRLDASHALEQLAVTVRRSCAELEDPVELLQLGQTDRGLHVRPAVVESQPHVVEPGASLVVAPLVPQAAQ